MKRLQLITIGLLFTFNISIGQAHFLERFDFEVGVNRSIVMNRVEMFPNSDNANISSDRANKESPSYTNNFSLSIGFQMHKHHHIRIRHARNTVGSHFSGTVRGNGWCGNGAMNQTYLNAFNQIKNSTLGAMYEFQIDINPGNFAIGIGVEKQWNDFVNTYQILPGILYDNLAFHSSMGYLFPLYDSIQLHSKFFVTQSFQNSDQLNTTEMGGYVPIQIGCELGVRLRLN
ncbi:MAG: hypothetical protein P1U56_09780 [Saprospiraceae bacterium]|nr:hypothetical protein [Saprospiraceae bacterium]